MPKFKHSHALGPQVAVVLGGGVHSNGTPWPATALRAQAAAQLARKYPRMSFILSGDGSRQRIDVHPEAIVMARLMLTSGIARRRLLIENESIDTIGNAFLSTARFLYGKKPRPLTVITSPFHTARAILAFQGMLPETWKIHSHASAPATDDTQRATSESGGIDWMHRFFEGITPGDLPSIAARLQTVGKPFYKTHPLVVSLAKKAA
jgi:uncharacterized SAM-binding protein YcdF (DUF218 family)